MEFELYSHFSFLRLKLDALQSTYLSKKIVSTSAFRVGIDSESCPVILIPEELFQDTKWNKANHRLKHLELSFHQPCQVVDVDSNIVLDKKFTIVKLFGANEMMIRYFFEIMNILISELCADLTVETLNRVITNLIRIFSVPTIVDEKKILGLWGELLYILESSESDKSILAWHQEVSNIFDFDFEDFCIEIKTTLKTNRIHEFNNNQVKEYKLLKVLVASIQTEKTQLGTSVQDLWNEIKDLKITSELKEKCSKIIIDTIGTNIEFLSEPKFNYNYGVSTLKMFESTDLPSVEQDNLHHSIQGVRLLIDLDSIS